MAYDAGSRADCYEKPPNRWVIGTACRSRRSFGGINTKVGDTIKRCVGVYGGPELMDNRSYLPLEPELVGYAVEQRDNNVLRKPCFLTDDLGTGVGEERFSRSWF